MPHTVARSLAAIEGFGSHSIFGKSLHVYIPDPTADEGALRRKLEASGQSIERFRKIEPSLEDVFTQLFAERGTGGRA